MTDKETFGVFVILRALPDPAEPSRRRDLPACPFVFEFHASPVDDSRQSWDGLEAQVGGGTRFAIADELDPKWPGGTIEDGLVGHRFSGPLDNYFYSTSSGEQVLLGTEPGSRDAGVLGDEQFVNLNQNQGRLQRRASTWQELRNILAEGWVMGTDKYTGVWFRFIQGGRTYLHQPHQLFVYRTR